MVVPLRPGKFYGSSLPRPRFYTDIKFSDERVDPPVSVLDPLMSWANEAHWSMGGLSMNRLRLQGKIEGNVQKLRKEQEKALNKKIENSTPISSSKKGVGIGGRRGGDLVDSPPPAPILKKKRGRAKLLDEEEEEFEEDEEDEEETEIETRKVVKAVKRNGEMKKRRRLVRKLGDDFELVASENQKSGRSPLKDLSNGLVSDTGVALRTRSRRSMVVMEEEGEDDNGGKKSKVAVENGKAKKVSEKNVSVSPKKVSKKNREKGSVSPNGSRSSPRLKQKSI
ncbi:uncharacterized protein [Spinacia oleracea]|uniref:Uncharacterized protein n=1 Tax=Spinacia oleracea TaxID=3562 RepID=A0A9R0I6Y4_SPIOL|nr:uncharacterized protein LOC110783587 [Spinacia oleracea]